MEFFFQDEYKKALADDRRIEQKAIPYMIGWVRRFITLVENPSRWSFHLNEYFDEISKVHEPWQLSQAADSIQRYQALLKSKGSLSIESLQNWATSLEKCQNELRRQGKSLHTEKAYLYWLRLFHSRLRNVPVVQLETQQVKEFLTYLAVERKVSPLTQNQAFNALLFFYRFVLNKQVSDLDSIPRAKKPQRLPVVLTKEEIKEVISHLPQPYATMAKLLYGSGLLLAECLNLRIKDIDFNEKSLTVRSGKGNKDRKTVVVSHNKLTQTSRVETDNLS